MEFKVINGTNLEANCLKQTRKHAADPDEQTFLFDLPPFYWLPKLKTHENAYITNIQTVTYSKSAVLEECCVW